jgi:hypothetical protein
MVVIFHRAQTPRLVWLGLNLQLLRYSQKQAARKQWRCHRKLAIVSKGKLGKEPVFSMGQTQGCVCNGLIE